ncbi:N-acyl amino acid synthase FeeM domain-containing protein [Hyphomicrobium nitrativorans]|uniref:N-acyl amino acid synthase FeeM domain-containing protein n=1 Tax=Hyphomicrobium nitrativorans TaxID=1427356 RepID=UPI00130DA761|nr:acyl-homoserine-lactone synthase [Hyphomicrobium nitrativorans]
MGASMMFQPPLVLDNNNGDTAKNFPISLEIYSSHSDKTDLHRLRYRAFLAAGWIRENDAGMLSDRFDALDTTVAVGAFHKGACIGALRLAFGGAHALPHSMPCEDAFPDEVRALIAQNCQRLVEFSRMAVEPTLSNRSFRTTLYASLVRAGVMLTIASRVDMAVVAVHKKVSPFYQAMCGFEVLGKSASYAEIDEPTEFLGLRAQALEARRKKRSGFFAFSPEEIAAAERALARLSAQGLA